jgi:hypothetical protein
MEKHQHDNGVQYQKQCNIKVAVRLRPLLRSELQQGHKSTRVVADDEAGEI